MLDRQELNTVLAALRFYQHHGMGDPVNRPDWLQEIACPEPASDTSLNASDIDALCQFLNCASWRRDPATESARGGYLFGSGWTMDRMAGHVRPG